jgi:hypothetical protein
MRSSIKTCFAVVVMCCALLLAACGSSSVAAKPTATPTFTPSPTPLLDTTFTSTDGVYSFSFPGSWSKTPLTTSPIVNGVKIASPDGKDFLLVLPINQGFTEADFKEFLTSFLKGAGVPDAKLASDTAQSGPLGANTWSGYEATGTYNATPYTGTELYLTHAGNAFIVIAMDPTADDQTMGDTYFKPMVESLKFLK